MSPSAFRPPVPPDPAVLDDHRPLLRSLERRGLLRGGLSLGALSLLTGCDAKTPGAVEQALRGGSGFNELVQQALFDPAKSAVLKPPKFNAYYDVEDMKPVNGADWRLELGGQIESKAPWTLAQLRALPAQTEIIRHVCVEGWDYIGSWSGPTLRSFFERVGADMRAKYVVFQTADNYPSSIDMATALHPQTLLALDYAGEPLADPFGFPLRLRMSTKLGYKNPKWITSIEVTNSYVPGYWEKTGFGWFAGI